MRRLLFIVGGIVLVLAIVVVTYVLGARDQSTTFDVHAVAKQHADEKVARAGKVTNATRPPVGAYLYRGVGHESASALGGSQHTFPKQIALEVAVPEGAAACEWKIRFLYIKEHVEERTWCTDADGVAETAARQTVQFFRITQDEKFTCEDDAYRMLQHPKANQKTWTYRCAGEDTKLATKLTSGAWVNVQVGKAKVITWKVSYVTTLTGKTHGTYSGTFWYTASGLPAHFINHTDVTTHSVLGDTRFREDADYTLTSVTPA